MLKIFQLKIQCLLVLGKIILFSLFLEISVILQLDKMFKNEDILNFGITRICNWGNGQILDKDDY